MHIALARYFFARHLLREQYQHAELVLLTDSRDVFFQADPFRNATRGLVTGLEGPNIEACAFNRSWIADLYEVTGLQQIGSSRIVCSGVTLGTRTAVVQYLDQMCEEIVRHLPVCAYHHGYDQGIHNWLIHSGVITNATLASNGGTEIATLHHTDVDDFDFSADHGLRTKKGESIAIVHQYDRKPVLAKWCAARWGSTDEFSQSISSQPLWRR